MSSNALGIKTYTKLKTMRQFRNTRQTQNNKKCNSTATFITDQVRLPIKRNTNISLNHVSNNNNEKYNNATSKYKVGTQTDNLDTYSHSDTISTDPQIRGMDIKVKLEPEVQIHCDINDDFAHNFSGNNQMRPIEIEGVDEELRCPKCRITYMNRMSLKNHIQVCKVGSKLLDPQIEVQQNSLKNKICSQKNLINGIRKLNEDEKKSLKILEQSCFNNMDKVIYDVRSEEENIDYITTATKPIYECEECDEMYYNSTKFSRHCYAHTFIKIGKKILKLQI